MSPRRLAAGWIAANAAGEIPGPGVAGVASIATGATGTPFLSPVARMA